MATEKKTLLKIAYGAKTDKGLVRELNEDHLIAREIPGRPDIRGLYAVADGMGGHNAGEVASQLAIDTFGTLAHSPQGFSSNGYKYVLEEILSMANQKVFSEAASDASKRGMGTTFTGVLVEQNTLHLVHVGDSRAYMLRAGRMQQISEEHSYVADLLKQGKISKAEAKNHKDANIITRALGLKESIKPDIKSLPLADGDVLFLCTDGITDLVLESEIQKILEANANPQQAADELSNVANMRGGDDNNTAVVLYVGKKKTVGVKRKLFSRGLVIGGIVCFLAAIGFFAYDHIKERFEMVGVPSNMGKISVKTTIPGAIAYINGVPIGKTPLSDIQFDVGTHLLEVKLPGYQSTPKKITISGHQKTVVDAKLYGTLQINSVPAGARIIINGKTLQQETPAMVQLEAGSDHTLTLAKEGYESQTVKKKFFQTGPAESVTLRLPSFGTIELESYKTDGVQIYVDKVLKKVAFVKGKATLSHLVPGHHVITGKAASGQDEVSVDVSRGVTKAVLAFGLKGPETKASTEKDATKAAAKPAEKTGKVAEKTAKSTAKDTSLQIKVNITDFYCSISGAGIDTLPKLVKGNVFTKVGLPPGEYNIIISKDGYDDAEKTVTLEEGKPANLNVSLTRQ
jgi:protein phosphatase